MLCTTSCFLYEGDGNLATCSHSLAVINQLLSVITSGCHSFKMHTSIILVSSILLAATVLESVCALTLEKRAKVPTECLRATNITDFWRKDNRGSNIQPGGPHSINGYSCDLHMSSHWFRFTGKAGTRMLNTCPEPYSCGTRIPMWSDAPMPTKVGQPELVKCFERRPAEGCRSSSNRMLVMRCSERPDDFIYKSDFLLSDPCNIAFCGM